MSPWGLAYHFPELDMHAYLQAHVNYISNDMPNNYMIRDIRMERLFTISNLIISILIGISHIRKISFLWAKPELCTKKIQEWLFALENDHLNYHKYLWFLLKSDCPQKKTVEVWTINKNLIHEYIFGNTAIIWNEEFLHHDCLWTLLKITLN